MATEIAAVSAAAAAAIAAGTFYKPRTAACSLMPTWQIASTEANSKRKREKEKDRERKSKELLLTSAANQQSLDAFTPSITLGLIASSA